MRQGTTQVHLASDALSKPFFHNASHKPQTWQKADPWIVSHGIASCNNQRLHEDLKFDHSPTPQATTNDFMKILNLTTRQPHKQAWTRVDVAHLAAQFGTQPPVGAWNRHVANWRSNPETAHILPILRGFLGCEP